MSLLPPRPSPSMLLFSSLMESLIRLESDSWIGSIDLRSGFIRLEWRVWWLDWYLKLNLINQLDLCLKSFMMEQVVGLNVLHLPMWLSVEYSVSWDPQDWECRSRDRVENSTHAFQSPTLLQSLSRLLFCFELLLDGTELMKLINRYTITGFDASAHMSEETTNAPISAPLGVLISVVVSSIFGFMILLGFLFSIQDFQSTLNSNQPVLQILIDVFGIRGAQVGMGLILVCVWHCGLFSITSNSRMMYGFARDRGLPPRYFGHVHPNLKCPVGAGQSFIFLRIPKHLVLIIELRSSHLSWSSSFFFGMGIHEWMLWFMISSLVIRPLGILIRLNQSRFSGGIGSSNQLSFTFLLSFVFSSELGLDHLWKRICEEDLN